MASTQQEVSAQEKPQEKEQMAAQLLEETEKQQETVVSEGTETDHTRTGAFMGAAKVFEEGVDFVGEKAPEVASVVLHKVKKSVSAAYGTSSTLVREAYHAASDYADEYKHKIEIRKLKAQREATCAKLGSIIYTRVIVAEQPPAKTLADQGITSLLQQIQNLDSEIVKIGKELEND